MAIHKIKDVYCFCFSLLYSLHPLSFIYANAQRRVSTFDRLGKFDNYSIILLSQLALKFLQQFRHVNYRDELLSHLIVCLIISIDLLMYSILIHHQKYRSKNSSMCSMFKENSRYFYETLKHCLSD